jgi:hypothetical protein
MTNKTTPDSTIAGGIRVKIVDAICFELGANCNIKQIIAIESLLQQTLDDCLPKEYPNPDKKYLETGDWDALTAQRAFTEAIDQARANLANKFKEK